MTKQWRAWVEVETPDGTRESYSGVGEAIGDVTDEEALKAAEGQALHDAPEGSKVVDSELF